MRIWIIITLGMKILVFTSSPKSTSTSEIVCKSRKIQKATGTQVTGLQLVLALTHNFSIAIRRKRSPKGATMCKKKCKKLVKKG